MSSAPKAGLEGRGDPAHSADSAYVLPLRWSANGPIEELSEYLGTLAGHVDEILVVDGSAPDQFEIHATYLGGIATHIRPHADLNYAMGKVNGVITGVRECSGERVVIADDDVRYEPESLARVLDELTAADLVRPQNFFTELPWHAHWDTARSLLNRVFTGDPTFPVGDFPGTLAINRSRFFESGAYDGDALFENLELMRTVSASGGSVVTLLDVYVGRRAPSAGHFFSQRVRQAYDDFAIPGRILAFLLVLPLVLVLSLRGNARRLLGIGAAISIGVAEVGRRRSGGRGHFPFSASLLAPAWIAERSICAWLALGARLRGGVRYGDGRLRMSANSLRSLRRRGGQSQGESARPGSAGSGAALSA